MVFALVTDFLTRSLSLLRLWWYLNPSFSQRIIHLESESDEDDTRDYTE